MGKLDGKVAVISGRASGLGKQHALRFANDDSWRLPPDMPNSTRYWGFRLHHR